MANQKSVLDISRVRVKAGSEDRMIEIWADVVKEFNTAAGGAAVLQAKLLRPQEGDVWADIWQWTSKEAAKAVMEANLDLPAFKEMQQITELVGVEWYDVVGELDF